MFVCVCVRIYKFIYIYKEKYKKTNNPKFDEFIMKFGVKRFGYNNLLQDFKFMKSVDKIAMDILHEFKVDFHNKLINFRLFFFYFSSYCRI